MSIVLFVTNINCLSYIVVTSCIYKYIYQCPVMTLEDVRRKMMSGELGRIFLMRVKRWRLERISVKQTQ